MSHLSVALNDYLRLRRSLGYKLERAGQLLADFVAYAEAAGAEHVRVDLAVAWALLASNPDTRWRAQRLGILRGFARYLHAIDPAHEVPPRGLIPAGRGRPAPFLYSKGQVVALMAAARGLRSPLQAATVETTVGLLAVSGLRVGEVIRLNNGDVDFEQGSLVVRSSKSGKSRIVPLHSSTVEALHSYRAVRDRFFLQPRSDSFFVSTVGKRVRSGNLRDAFASVAALAGLPARMAGHRPRLADLRHSFTVQTLLDWHEAALDVGAGLPILSAYLGHISPASTYWYLSASPQLLTAAAASLEHSIGGIR
ncbi:MAG: tyrosine-type recombinase/integrase [Pseudonocardiaceae bacterium]